jgi:hypothetical protein
MYAYVPRRNDPAMKASYVRKLIGAFVRMQGLIIVQGIAIVLGITTVQGIAIVQCCVILSSCGKRLTLNTLELKPPNRWRANLPHVTTTHAMFYSDHVTGGTPAIWWVACHSSVTFLPAVFSLVTRTTQIMHPITTTDDLNDALLCKNVLSLH